MTLTELLIAMGIFPLIMIGVSQLFLKSWQNYNFVANTNTASVAANKGASDIVNVLRRVKEADNGSFPITSATSADLKVYSDIDKDGVTEKVHYYLSGTNLMVGISNPSGFPLTYPAGDSTSKIIINNVVNTGAQPLFYYYDGDNNLISSPVGAVNIVRMVKISLAIYRKEGNLNIESYASLRNLSDHDAIK